MSIIETISVANEDDKNNYINIMKKIGDKIYKLGGRQSGREIGPGLHGVKVYIAISDYIVNFYNKREKYDNHKFNSMGIILEEATTQGSTVIAGVEIIGKKGEELSHKGYSRDVFLDYEIWWNSGSESGELKGFALDRAIDEAKNLLTILEQV